MNRKFGNADILRQVRTYPSTPKHFDPNKASPEELKQYGLPRRPDPEKEPEFARIWKRAFARPVRFVKARLAVDPVMSARQPLHRGGTLDQFGPNGWAGVVKMMSKQKGSDFANPATMVFAQWQLPDVPLLGPAGDPLAVAFWVGLDGFEALPEPASKQVVQAGVAAQVNLPGFWPWESGNVKWWAWVEWNTDQGTALKPVNLPVAAGDEIIVTLFVEHNVPDPDRDNAPTDLAAIWMLNLTRRIGTNWGLFAPKGVVSEGLSAEWIVEVPSESPHLPIFTPVTFTDCTAGSLQHGVFNLTDGILEEIYAPSNYPGPGTAYTKTSIASPTVAVVEELNVDWF